MKSPIVRCAVFLLVFCSFSIQAQQSQAQQTLVSSGDLTASIGKVVRVETSGGGTFQGKLLGAQEDRIELLDADGVILQISRPEIKRILEIVPERGGNLYFQDASSNRLIVIPTGFGMEKDEFHIADLEILGVTASYGVSEHFSAWAGVSIPGAVVNARFSFALANGFIGTSVGSFVAGSWVDMGVPEVPAARGVLIPYLITSFGSENRNLTVGAGGIFTFAKPGAATFFEYAAVAAVLGGKIPLSSTTALITENWVFFPNVPASVVDPMILMAFPSVAFRIAGNRLSWDIGATYPFEVHPSVVLATLGFPLPILTLTYRIN